MKKQYSRMQRVEDEMQRELAKLIQTEMGDPRLTLVTITAVKVARDLAHAKIYITQHKEEAEIAQTVKVLNKAAGRLRYLLAQNIKLRAMPELHFIYDASIRYGSHLSELIDQAIANDEQKHN
jgi:ribosome-binding factor A